MSYRLLSKEYYKSKDNYNSLYISRFNSESAVHLPIKINDSKSFFIYTNDIVYMLGDIYSFNKGISEVISSLPAIAKRFLIKNNIGKEIVITNEIEGVTSTKQEINLAIEVNENKRSNYNREVRFKGLVKKYLEIINNLDLEIKRCEDIRRLYDDLVLDEINKKDYPDGNLFRKNSVSVITSTGKEKHRGLNPESEIIGSMQESLDFLNDESNKINGLIKIAIFHYYFGYIHPFYDGNGRIDRFISSYLIRKELGVYIALNLSFSIKNDIKKYYDSFDISNDPKNKGDLTYFIESFLGFIYEAYMLLGDDLKYAKDKLNYYENILENGEFNKDEVKIIEVLIQNEVFTDNSGLGIAELVENLDVGESKVRSVLSNLEGKEVLNVTKEGKKKKYAIILEKLES